MPYSNHLDAYNRCRVKVCGITSIADALMVSHAGVDAIGLVFYPPSSRYITADQAAAICKALPPFVNCVGLFLHATETEVRATLEKVNLDVLQFHGHETAAFCRQFGKPYLKGVGMQGLAEQGGFSAYQQAYPDAQGFLLDSHAPGAAGGTGQTFDWCQIPTARTKAIILAGGLKPDNVAQAIQLTKPYALDVSSGVEARPGIKDAQKVQAFMQAAHTT